MMLIVLNCTILPSLRCAPNAPLTSMEESAPAFCDCTLSRIFCASGSVRTRTPSISAKSILFFLNPRFRNTPEPSIR